MGNMKEELKEEWKKANEWSPPEETLMLYALHLKEQYGKQLATLRKQHEEQLELVRTQQVDALRRGWSLDTLYMKEQHEEQLANVRKHHEEQLATVRKKVEEEAEKSMILQRRIAKELVSVRKEKKSQAEALNIIRSQHHALSETVYAGYNYDFIHQVRVVQRVFLMTYSFKTKKSWARQLLGMCFETYVQKKVRFNRNLF
ncbi:hypothetical protein FACS189472_11220 [Alphaproteobacteria bacterium]|nr:hypothetical protein FACS189472_11220 [Alphaproteobacteria bacterium]